MYKYMLLLALALPFAGHTQEKDRYYEKVKAEIKDLQQIFDYILKNNLHEGFSKKTIWLNEKHFRKEKLIRQHFNKLHIKEVVIQGRTGYKTIAPEDSVIILKRKYYSPLLLRYEIIYDARISPTPFPPVEAGVLSFRALTDRMYYLRR